MTQKMILFLLVMTSKDDIIFCYDVICPHYIGFIIAFWMNILFKSLRNLVPWENLECSFRHSKVVFELIRQISGNGPLKIILRLKQLIHYHWYHHRNIHVALQALVRATVIQHPPFRVQIFEPSLRSMETQNSFCVPRVCAPKKHHGQQCVRNNASSFARALR